MSLEIIGGAIAVTAIAALYAYKTGNGAEVDFDNDGENEVDFAGDDNSSSTAPEELYPPENEGESEGDTEDTTSTAPEEVHDIGGNLTEITGIGETKADTLVEEGFETANELYFASDENLTDVTGIGSHVLDQIRGDIGSFDSDE